MNQDTLKRVMRINSDIREIDDELKHWGEMEKGFLAHHSNVRLRSFKSSLIPANAFNVFKESVINSLKAKKLDLLQELETL